MQTSTQTIKQGLWGGTPALIPRASIDPMGGVVALFVKHVGLSAQTCNGSTQRSEKVSKAVHELDILRRRNPSERHAAGSLLPVKK